MCTDTIGNFEFKKLFRAAYRAKRSKLHRRPAAYFASLRALL